MSEKVYIEIDASPWFDVEGVTTSVWIGDACEPCYENKQTFEELIDKELEAHCVFGKLCSKLSNKNVCDNTDRARDFVLAIEQAAVYARKRYSDLLKN